VTLTLAGIEAIVAGSGAGEAIEALLPPAVRGRQLTAGTLLAGKMLALADGRPRPPHQSARRADRPARRRPETAGRHRRLETRPAPAHLPAGRAH
jgi:hypothetical protein